MKKLLIFIFVNLSVFCLISCKDSSKSSLAPIKCASDYEIPQLEAENMINHLSAKPGSGFDQASIRYFNTDIFQKILNCFDEVHWIPARYTGAQTEIDRYKKHVVEDYRTYPELLGIKNYKTWIIKAIKFNAAAADMQTNDVQYFDLVTLCPPPADCSYPMIKADTSSRAKKNDSNSAR